MDRLQLHELTTENLPAVLRLRLRQGQDRFVAPVAESIAEAFVTPTAWPRAIVAGRTVVGFVMASFDPTNEIAAFRCGVWRLNVSADHQRCGAGRFAVEEVAREAHGRGYDTMTVLWEPGADGPQDFYLRCGFEPTGEVLFGEVVGSRSTLAGGGRR